MYTYQLTNPSLGQTTSTVIKRSDNAYIPFDPANTDYQAFKTAVLDQQPGGLVEDGDSFSINANPNDSILEDADGNVMTIDESKAYVRELP
jgi:cellulose biosynthesis protein BcsQ